MRTLGQELDITKVLNQQQKDLNVAERDFYNSIMAGLAEAINAIQGLKKVLFDEVILPLETEFGKSKEPAVGNLLYDIMGILNKYNASIESARSQFIFAFGRKEFDVKYKSIFSNLPIFYIPKYQLKAPVMFKTMPLKGLGAIPVLPAVASTIFKSKIWEAIADKLMSIPLIRDTIGKILTVLYDIWTNIFFTFRPEERTRRNELERKAKYLKKASKFVENSFNIIITALQTLQTKLDKKINAFITKAETKEEIEASQTERKVYVPYTILPKPVKKEIELPSGGKAVSVEYKREYKPKTSQSSFGDYSDGEGKFSLLQYATSILIPKERFPYGK